MIDSLAKGFFDLLFNIINTLINVVFSPVNSLLQPFLDNLVVNTLVGNFYYVINNYVVPLCSFFVDIVPPLTWSAILLHITITIGLYAIALITHVIFKPLKVIKKLIPFA